MTPDILCIGSVLWDTIGRTETTMKVGYDVPGRVTRIPGGVALNIAMTLARFGVRPAVLTLIGNDPEGRALTAECNRLGVATDFATFSDELSTDQYMAVECNGAMIAAIADAASLEAAGADILTPLRFGPLGRSDDPWAGTVALDGNLTTDLLEEIAADPAFALADLRVAPASPGKAKRMRALFGAKRVTLYVNRAEAELICDASFPDAAQAATALVDCGVARAVVTDSGAMVADATQENVLTGTPPSVEVLRVTGAGDTFMASHIASELDGQTRQQALDTALSATAAYISKDDTP